MRSTRGVFRSRGAGLLLTAGIALAPGLALAAQQVFEPGDILIDMSNSQANASASIYDGYGMVFRLAEAGLPVSWYIRGDKAYGQLDLTGIRVDPNPDRDADLTDGTEVLKDYAGSVFLIADPNRATTYNEAWDTIFVVQEVRGFAGVDLDELRQTSILPRSDVHTIDYVPRVAYADNNADDELVLIQYPAGSLVKAPGSSSVVGDLAGGALFSSAGCDADLLFDLFIQSHYGWQENPNWQTDTDDESVAQRELTRFHMAGGLGIYQCLSATVEQNVHWLTEAGSPVVEGRVSSNFYEFEPAMSFHPFLQTLGQLPMEGGGFQTWDVTQNRFLPVAQHILNDPVTGDLGYVFGTVGAGKVYYMGGHRRKELADRRLLYNAILFHAIVPGPKVNRKLTELNPEFLVAQTPNRITVTKNLNGGSLAENVVLVDTFDPIVTLDQSSVDIRVPGGSFVWNPAIYTLTLNIGSVHPDDLVDGVMATYDILVTPPAVGTFRLLTHSSLFIDYWRAQYNAQSDLCLNARVLPQQGDLVCTLSPGTIEQDVTGTRRQTFTMTVTNRVSTNRFIKDIDTVRLVIPPAYGVPPTNVVGPSFPTAGWTNAWDSPLRELSFRNPDVDFDWTTGMALAFRFDLGVPVGPGVSRFPCTATLEGNTLVFTGTPPVVVLSSPALLRGLLRNDQLVALEPHSAQAGIFSFGPGDVNSLDVEGPDGWAQPGEGALLGGNGSSDDDDFYILNFVSGSSDPDPAGVVGDLGRPLIFYQVLAGGNTLRMVRDRTAPSTVTIFF